MARVVDFLRDTRHLTGRRPTTHHPAPPDPGLALAVDHDDEGVPRLVIGSDDGTLTTLQIHKGLDLLVEDDRYCVGNRSNGQWAPCAAGGPADRFSRCPECHPLPVRECVFNPRCAGCKQEFCTSPHEVYIAYHGTRKKVGMTRSSREGHRLIEQGADAAFIIAWTPDRFQARNMEDRITSKIGIPQALPTKRMLARLTQAIPRKAIEQDQRNLAARIETETHTPSGPLFWTPRGFGLPLKEVPVMAATVGHHQGTIEAAHGRFLFYRTTATHPEPQAPPPLWALDLKDVVTHRLRHKDD